VTDSWSASDCLGIVKPGVDAHVLGVTSVAELLQECGCTVAVAPEEVCRAANRPEGGTESEIIERWIRDSRVNRIGFSYRLNPDDGVALFDRLVRQLERRRLFADQGGPVASLYFAGLPDACRLARDRVPRITACFDGEETPAETLARLGIRQSMLPQETGKALAYDRDRMSFGEEIVRRGDYLGLRPPDRSGYPGFAQASDSLVARLAHAARTGGLPLTRAHMGPYLPDRDAAVRLFLQWTRTVAASGHLDVLSIGTSQLTQARFGEPWGDEANGGGVPLATAAEFADVWSAARPMLVRSYAGSKNVAALARMLDETIHNAWHALSLWWFCRIDNRGPSTLRENLVQQFAALRHVASAGKPYEPNVPHHFAFRGADDATYVVSGWLAARAAKELGVRTLVVQTMLNTPKHTWGVQDLAKARALLALLRELEGREFRVVLQPRAGLDCFSADPAKAKAQLAAVTALMDDIEPDDPSSPPIVHVVSWSEAVRFADPPVIAESVQITRHALAEHRRLRAGGLVDDMGRDPEVKTRTRELLAESRAIIGAIETSVPDPWSPAGMYRIFAAGFLPVPYLWECRDELAAAVAWRTRSIRGSVRVVDERGVPLPVEERIARARAALAGGTAT
jgi:hypothetical protein